MNGVLVLCLMALAVVLGTAWERARTAAFGRASRPPREDGDRPGPGGPGGPPEITRSRPGEQRVLPVGRAVDGPSRRARHLSPVREPVRGKPRDRRRQRNRR